MYAYLEGHRVVETNSYAKWAACYENSLGRRVAYTCDPGKGIAISTVFIGVSILDQLHFETMFVMDGEQSFCRYPTWEAAEAGHWKLVKKYLPYHTRPHLHPALLARGFRLPWVRRLIMRKT